MSIEEFLTDEELMDIIKVSKKSTFNYIARGRNFPKPIFLTKRVRRWRKSDFELWGKDERD